MSSVAVFAPAKLNLFLHITGRRANGYHELQSLAMFANVGDRLRLTPSEHFSLGISGPFAHALAADDTNLALKAAKQLHQHCTLPGGVEIHLEKHIPLGAGLGGGSADAAAVLAGMCKMHDVSLERAASIAQTLGSDILACLHGKPCYMEGVGERITPVAVEGALHALLVHPGVPLSTPGVYAGVCSPYHETLALPSSLNSAELLDFLHRTHNDLEPPAMALLPEIKEMLLLMRAAEGCLLARMTGSGSACFGLFATQEETLAAEEELRTQRPGWWTVATSLRS